MTDFERHPFRQFNFLVQADGVGNTSFQGGFSDVSGLGMEVEIAEYRNITVEQGMCHKVSGTAKMPDVTLKRGLADFDAFQEWLQDVRSGRQESSRTVTIQLQDELRSHVVQTWTLERAQPMKFSGPTPSRAGREIAFEELVLWCEAIKYE